MGIFMSDVKGGIVRAEGFGVEYPIALAVIASLTTIEQCVAGRAGKPANAG